MPEPPEYGGAMRVPGLGGSAGSGSNPRENSQDDDTAYCRDLSKRTDRALWRAVHYAPHALRPGLFALNAFAAELEQIPTHVTEPALGRLRLAWWQDAISNLTKKGGPANNIEADGVEAEERPRSRYAHPVIAGLAPLANAQPRMEGFLHEMIASTGWLLDLGDRADRATIAQYFSGTQGSAACARLYWLDTTISNEFAEQTRALAMLYGFWHNASQRGVPAWNASSKPRALGPGASEQSVSRPVAPSSRRGIGRWVSEILTAPDRPVDWREEYAGFERLSGELSRLCPRITPRLMPVFAPFALMPMMIKRAQARIQLNPQTQAEEVLRGTQQPPAQLQVRSRDRDHMPRGALLFDYLIMTCSVLRGKL